MPTPIKAFREIAARYGDVDPADLGAVENFFEVRLQDLSPAIRERIFAELMERDGESDDEAALVLEYPVEDVPLPRLDPSLRVNAPATALPRAPREVGQHMHLIRPSNARWAWIGVAVAALIMGVGLLVDQLVGANEYLGHAFESGGAFMWGLAAVALSATTLAAHGYLSVARLARSRQQLLDSLEEAVDSGSSSALQELNELHEDPVARILLSALKSEERNVQEAEDAIAVATADEAERRSKPTRLLLWASSVAPLVGLLGTITGFVSALSKTAGKTGAARSAAIGEGIESALYLTAFGLTVALLGILASHVLSSKLRESLSGVQEAAMRFLDGVRTANRVGRRPQFDWWSNQR